MATGARSLTPARLLLGLYVLTSCKPSVRLPAWLAMPFAEQSTRITCIALAQLLQARRVPAIMTPKASHRQDLSA